MRDYRKEVLKILKDFDMPNATDFIASLSEDQVKDVYVLLQRIMIRVALQAYGEKV